VTTGMEQLSCQELVELVTSYFEDALATDERDEFERHLETCDGCGEYVEQMRMTITLTGSLSPADLSADAERKLLAAFRDWSVG
jgi:anti-sigma factor RsiW